MKKFIFIMVAILGVLAAVSCSSCSNDETPWGIEYSLESNGTTNGFVDMTFYNGFFSLKGDANYTLVWNSGDTLLKADNARDLSTSLTSDDKDTMMAASYVDAWFNSAFDIKDYGGLYDVYIKGYVKETKTQITFSIDKHFTNIPTNIQAVVDNMQ